MAKSEEELMVLLGRESAKFSRAFSRGAGLLQLPNGRGGRASVWKVGSSLLSPSRKRPDRHDWLNVGRATVRPPAGRLRSNGCQTLAIASV